ncbi:hypothetical protein [Mycolicibacterium insubricum]|uniref:hypothetical protein n=1 Tax=Mycolicibacterium insubricum TaxID=444597 RepID=UPI0027E2EAFF|nr:hypothetical protein [Mycolicibacterium insubricum]MCV7083504.1 hypothetical protein [Mycolicibacterium insubricum]
MTKHAQGIPLGAWLSDLPDEQLVRLLTLRPDLAQPAPASLAALAARAQARQSVQAATDELDLRHLAVLDALLVLHANRTPAPVADIAALLEHRIDADDLDAVLADLADRALVWGTDRIRVAGEAGAGLPWYPGQLALDSPRRSVDQLSAAIDALPDEQAELLSRLSEGSPVGRTRDAAPTAPADHPVPRLLATALLTAPRRRDGAAAPARRAAAARSHPRPGAAGAAGPRGAPGPRSPTSTAPPRSPSWTCCARRSRCWRCWVPPRCRSCAAAAWVCGMYEGWPRPPRSPRPGWR